uniref:NB-ARC domain-containing protein n=1 Tax=Leersia perrieri TaxID=77586 RepID=A0A0D9WPD3_9ORYZ
MKKIATLSYNYLPSQLKPCFLYLSIFPEDIDIKRKRIVHRWIAEGFIKGKDAVKIVDVAERYFSELINRSMIQPSRFNIDGTIKSCRVHDIMRDIMISISIEENFVHLIKDNGTCVVEGNIRHVVYHKSKCRKTGLDWSHVRSFTLFGDERPKELSPSLFSPRLKMVRVLDLQDVKFGISQKDMDKIGLLRHLRYLNIRYSEGYSSIYALPRSIGKLHDLHTLDLSNTYISTLPTEISGLESLCILRFRGQGSYGVFDPDNRKLCLAALTCMPAIMASANSVDRSKIIAELHMGCSSYWSTSSSIEGVRVPRGIKNLKKLEVLQTVGINQTSSKSIEEMGELTQLKKLHVVTKGSNEKKCKVFCAIIQKLTSLKSVHVDAQALSDIGSLEWLDSISSPPPLRSLRLIGYIETPSWFRELRQLVKMQLLNCQLKEDKIFDILGELPNLMQLFIGWHAYVGEKMVFKDGAFQNLRVLLIVSQEHLKEVRFEEGTSPLMERINISECILTSGIAGIKHLPKLNEISLGHRVKVKRLGQLEGELGAHLNRPTLRLLYEERSRYDLQDTQGSPPEVAVATEPLPHNAVGENSQSNQPDDERQACNRGQND